MAISQYTLRDFVGSVGATYIPSKPETFWQCDKHIAQLVTGSSVSESVNAQAQRLAADPHFLGDWGDHELFLHRGVGWTLSITILDAPRRYIHAIPEMACFVPLGTEGLTADRYELPASYRNELFEPEVKLTAAGTVSVGPGEVLRLETDRYAYDFRIPRTIPVLRLMTTPLRPLEWLFSKNTLQAWQANDADLASTQLRVAAYVLGKIAHQSSVAPLKRLASHSHHAVRWAAIQNLGRLNRSEALIKIREAVNDPHPHVRRAAQKTLDQIEKRAAPKP